MRQIEIDAGAVGKKRCKARAIVTGQLFFCFARLDQQTPRIRRRRWREARLFERPTEDPMVEVISAQRGVAIRRQHFEHSARELENRDIESSAAEVVHGIRAFRSVVEAVRDGRRRRLVQQSQHRQARNLCGVFRGLALGIVEVRRNGDDRAIDRSTE